MRERAQLVVLAAALVAVAFVPAVVAYHQMSYRGDVRAGAADNPLEETTGTLARGFHAAAADAAGEYGWDERREAVTAVRGDVARTLDALRGVREHRVYRLAYNETAARRRAERACPGGEGRAFGPCRAVDGVVVQERTNETRVLGAAIDVRIDSPDGSVRATVWVDGRR